jgi:replicative DNA helicase
LKTRDDDRPRVRAIDPFRRIPPHNEEAEAAVLSAVLADGKALDEVLELLRAEHFYSDAHQRIFAVAAEVRAKGQPVDVQTVAAVLHDRERLQAIGGVSYLAKIIDATPAVAHVTAHARIVLEKWKVRQAIEACQLSAAEGFADYGEVDEYLDRIEQRLYELAHTSKSSETTLVYDVVRASFERAMDATVPSIATGFSALDARTGGYFAGELVIIAARPGMGKTALALNQAVHIASRTPEPGSPRYAVAVFSLEMPKIQLPQRMICSEARVDLSLLRKKLLAGEAFDRYVEHAHRIAQLPIWLDDTPALGLLELRAKVRRVQRAFNRSDGTQKLGVVIVDYLQLMKGREGAVNREQEVSELSRGLKALAKELDVAVVALAQLNRAVETRGAKEKRPQLSDLRDSGGIEQDADVIQFIYRPEYYLRQQGTSDEANAVRGYAEIITAKQRNGPTGRDVLAYHDAYTRFEDASEADVASWMRDGDTAARPTKRRSRWEPRHPPPAPQAEN